MRKLADGTSNRETLRGQHRRSGVMARVVSDGTVCGIENIHLSSRHTFLGGKAIAGGMLEYWIGVLYPLEMRVPDEYDGVEIEAVKYAVFKLYGKPLQLTSFETHQLCLDELRERGLVRFEDHWCLERHERDDLGMLAVNTPVVTEYCISIV